MHQVLDALFSTAVRLGGQYGPLVAAGVLAVVGCGIALRFLCWALSRGRAKES
jgi:hypothetical protein